MEVPQVSLTLIFNDRERPALQSIRFMPGPEPRTADELQDRDLPKAVAVALLLFRKHGASPERTPFRIHAAKGDGGFVRTIRNAKSDSQSKSSIHALARGAFLRLFRSRGSQERCYIEIDLTRLKPSAVEIVLDGQVVAHPEILKQMIALIAARKGWNLDDYSIEAIPPGQPGSEAKTTLSEAPLDNPAFIAIREAVRNFCQDGLHEHLQVRYIRSTAELEDLWEIDNAAYGEASITYEKFQDWWFSYPSGLHALLSQFTRENAICKTDYGRIFSRGRTDRFPCHFSEAA